MLEIFKSGGPLMYIILILSVMGTAVIIERLIYFFVSEKGDMGAVKYEIEKCLENKDREGAIELCELYNNSSSKVLKELISETDFSIPSDLAYLEEKSREVALSQLPRLEKFMWLLGVTAHVTPLVGLLGTVSGMIKAFRVISEVGTGTPELLAEGISQALITTAAGLSVAIPALIFYNYFNKKIDNIVNEMEKSSVEFINLLRK